MGDQWQRWAFAVTLRNRTRTRQGGPSSGQHDNDDKNGNYQPTLRPDWFSGDHGHSHDDFEPAQRSAGNLRLQNELDQESARHAARPGQSSCHPPAAPKALRTRQPRPGRRGEWCLFNALSVFVARRPARPPESSRTWTSSPFWPPPQSPPLRTGAIGRTAGLPLRSLPAEEYLRRIVGCV